MFSGFNEKQFTMEGWVSTDHRRLVMNASDEIRAKMLADEGYELRLTETIDLPEDNEQAVDKMDELRRALGERLKEQAFRIVT